MKINLLIKLVFMVIIIIIMAYSTLPWLVMYIGIKLSPNPPVPQITYGEFPFRLEYEIDGQRKVIEDTLICQYDGIASDEGRGKYRNWKEMLKSGDERITLLKVDDEKEIYYTPGSANYYMGDYNNVQGYKHSFPNASMIEKNGKITHDRIIREDELLTKYNIKLISWDYSQPIKNSLSEK